MKKKANYINNNVNIITGIIFILLALVILVGKIYWPLLVLTSLALGLVWMTINLINLVNNSYELVFNNAGNKNYLILGYLLLIIIVIFCFAIFYHSSPNSSIKMGHLTYGECNDNFNLSIDNYNTDVKAVKSFGGAIYFSTITFFSVGYGDICPQGYFKMVSMFNAFMGHFIIVIVLGLAFIKYQRNNKKGGRKIKKSK